MDASQLNPMAMNGERANTKRIRNELLSDFGERINDPEVVPVVRGAGVQPQGVRSDVRWVGGGGRAQDTQLPNAQGSRRPHGVQISGSVRTLPARPSPGLAASGRGQCDIANTRWTGPTTNPRLPGYQPPRQTIQQPDYNYEMSAEELEEQRALLNWYSQRQQQPFGSRSNATVQTLEGTMAPYQPHPTQQIGYTPRNGGRRATPRLLFYEDDEEEDWYAADVDRMGTPYGGRTDPPVGDMFDEDDGFGSAMGGFGGDGFGDSDELWDEMTGRMDQMFGGMSLGGGYGGCRGGGDGGYGFFELVCI
jgi:hypothetical protein